MAKSNFTISIFYIGIIKFTEMTIMSYLRLIEDLALIRSKTNLEN